MTDERGQEVMNFRMAPELRKRLEESAVKRGETISTFLREAIRERCDRIVDDESIPEIERRTIAILTRQLTEAIREAIRP